MDMVENIDACKLDTSCLAAGATQMDVSLEEVAQSANGGLESCLPGGDQLLLPARANNGVDQSQQDVREIIFCRHSVSNFERQALPEFFAGKVDRTHFHPSQYLQIRNLFLDEWAKRKPQCLKFREMIRLNRGIGNVVSFGRVCKFLTSIGAINSCPAVKVTVREDEDEHSNGADLEPLDSVLPASGASVEEKERSKPDESSSSSSNGKAKKARKRKSYYLNEMGRLGIDPVACGFTIPESERQNVYSNLKKINTGIKTSVHLPQTSAASESRVDDQLSTAEPPLKPAPASAPDCSDNRKPGDCEQPSKHLSDDNSVKHNGTVDCSLPDVQIASNSKQTTELSDGPLNGSPTAVSETPPAEPEAAEIVKPSRTRPNPFKLIHCKKYGVELEAPFRVMISVEALTIIDVHAHCLQTEVIGLLGGRFCPLRCELHILTAEPCESLTASTSDLQCEMDPVSQASVSEKLSKAGYNVVGWYHSHPTFVPNPSLRDLETQAKYQELFAEGNQPFIAIILSPYSAAIHTAQRSTLISKYKCLMVSEEHNLQGDYRVPYEFLPDLVRKDKLAFNVVTRLQDLCSKLEGNNSLLPLMDKIKGRDIQYIQKLCASLRHYLELAGLSSKEAEHLLARIKETLSSQFKLKPSSR